MTLGIASAGAYAHLPHDPVLALGVSPDYQSDQTLFVATFPELNWSNRDILRSTDGGRTWTKLPNGMDNRFDFSAIRVSPDFSADHSVFAATRGDGVYQSVDQGNSWALINTGLVDANVSELEIGGSRNSDYTLYAAPGSGGIYRRSTGQTAWAQVLSPSISVSVIATSPDFSRDSTVMTADATGRLRISSNAGNTWNDMGQPANAIIYDIAIAPGNSAEIFLATSRRGIYYSRDSGKTFINKGTNLPAEAINNVAVSPNYLVDKTLFCTSVTHTVYRSTNGGSSWTLYRSSAAITHQTPAVNEFSELQVSRTFSSDRAVFLSAFDGLYRSTSAGTTWGQIQTRANLTPGLALSPKFAADQSVMATNYFGGGPSFSGDRGSTWSIRLSGWPGSGPGNPSFDIDFVQNHAGPPLAVATKNFGALGFTSDFGAHWDMQPIPELPDAATGPVYPTVLGLSPVFDVDREIYLGTIDHGVIQSLDGGVTWRTKRGVPVLVKVTSVAVSPNYANDHTAFAGNMGQIWRTTNGGDSWSRIGASSIALRGGLKYMWIALSPQFATDHLLFVGTNNGVYRSIDGGNTWQGIGRKEIGAATVIRQIEFSPNFAQDRTVLVNVRGRGLYLVVLDTAGGVSSLQNVGLPLLHDNVEFTEFRFSPSFRQDATLLGASRGDVYRSTNGGVTWVLVGHPGTG